MNSHRPKRITPQQITGQQGVNLVERAVLGMGFTWHPTNQGLEGGIDGFIEIRDSVTGNLTNNILQVQVKTTTRKWVYESNTEFTYRCEERDIDYWMQSNTPVVLVVVRPEGDEAYWANVKESFADPKRRQERNLRFDKSTQRFEASAATALMKLAVPKDCGPYMPATRHTEALISNLLEVKTFPPMIYVATTEHRDPQEIFDWAKQREIHLPSGWLLTEKSIRSVYDLREHPWVDLVDRGSVECFDADEWSDSDDPERQREFVRLMNQAVRGDMRIRHLWRSRDDNCFFFPARRDRQHNPLSTRYGYRSLREDTSREVVKVHRHPKTKDIVYCRHHAMYGAFVRLDTSWYLSITPHYVYTTDGKNPYPYGEDLLSGMKQLERQSAVLGQVIMWKHKLSRQRDDLFSKDKTAKPVITFGDLLEAECERAVPDAAWLAHDADLRPSDGGLF